MSVPVGKRAQGKLACIIAAEKLCRHTLKICKNRKYFTEDYYDSLTSDIIETAKDIFIDAWEANNIRVNDDPELARQRLRLQDTSIRKCNRLLALMQLAGVVFHLKTDRIEYWGRMCVEARDQLKAWHDSDKKRYRAVG